ncbi:MAG: NAD-dependent epimerase/dehydratase family protein [Chloroflexi bacterium]|nr:NAD-dependent epimerase/dehydratase family protein [Chloroflexota bacterium]
MRVVVLGGTRFIGRAILADLVAAGHEVQVVHRGHTEPDDLPPVEHRHLDRQDTAALREALASVRPDALVDTMALSCADAEMAVEALPGDIRLVLQRRVLRPATMGVAA